MIGVIIIIGSTKCEIKGIGFKSGGSQTLIRFACIKGFLECNGEVIDDTTITFDTPNYEKFGAMSVEGRVSVGGKPLCNTTISFDYFSVTSCETSIAFGPGLINGR